MRKNKKSNIINGRYFKLLIKKYKKKSVAKYLIKSKDWVTRRHSLEQDIF